MKSAGFCNLRLAYGLEQPLGRYLSAQFPQLMANGEYEPHVAIGFVDDDNKLFGAVGLRLTSYFEAELSIFAEHPGFFTRKTLREMFSVAFGTGVSRLQCVINKRNLKARKLVERLGFRFEGVKRKGFDGKRDATVYSLLAHECRWISPLAPMSSRQRSVDGGVV